MEYALALILLVSFIDGKSIRPIFIIAKNVFKEIFQGLSLIALDEKCLIINTYLSMIIAVTFNFNAF